MRHHKRHVALVGLMGAGKTTVGRLVARHLQRPFVDTDEMIVARAGRPVSEIFEHDGEAAFRTLERDALREVLAGPDSVIACGGGVVLDPENRVALREQARVVLLRASPDVLAQRLRGGSGRPLLAEGANVLDELERLAAARAGAYDEASEVSVDASGSVEAVAAAVVAVVLDTPAQRIRVDVPPRPYDVVVGPVSAVGDVLHGRRKVALITQSSLVESAASMVLAVLDAAGIPTIDPPLVIGDGESHKSLATIEFLSRQLALAGLLRGDAIVAVGGGLVGDVAGFAAAVYHRGVDVVQVPTTLLAMVDASIGGKTAVNLPEGKNLVGAFHQPLAVVADARLLATLPESEYRSGLGEVAKYALLGDESLLATIESRLEALLGRDPVVLADVIVRCASAKASVVAADPEERSGVRARLNYGHTLAHALETAAGYDLRHGEAVGIGLVFAGELAGALERIPPAHVERHRRVVAALGLPVKAPAGLNAAELLAVMHRDKKAAGGLTFVLAGPNGVELVDDPDAAALAKAFAAIGVQT